MRFGQGRLHLLGGGLINVDTLLGKDDIDESVWIATHQDVGTTTGHVGGNGDTPHAPGLGDDRRLTLVLFGVEHLVLDFVGAQQRAEALRGLYRGGTHEHGSPFGVLLLDVTDDSLEFGGLGAINQVTHVLAHHGSMRGDDGDFEVVDFGEFFPLGVSGTGHAAQLFVHAEEVLVGDGGQGDVFLAHAHAFFGLDRLV